MGKYLSGTTPDSDVIQYDGMRADKQKVTLMLQGLKYRLDSSCCGNKPVTKTLWKEFLFIFTDLLDPNGLSDRMRGGIWGLSESRSKRVKGEGVTDWGVRL